MEPAGRLVPVAGGDNTPPLLPAYFVLAGGGEFTSLLIDSSPQRQTAQAGASSIEDIVAGLRRHLLNYQPLQALREVRAS